MSGHAKLSPSGSATWIPCPGSVKLSEGVPNVSSPYAREGTAAHELGGKCLEMSRPASDFLGDTIVVEGESFEVDYEMVDNVQQYLDYCNGLEGTAYWVETKVYYTSWVPNGKGTADYIKINVLYDHETNTPHHTINIVDLKYGKGELVVAKDNSQAMIYALGALQTFALYYDFRDTDIVNCVIHQPRLAPPSEFKISVGELLKWAVETVVPKAKEALGENGSFKAGDKQCRWCLAKAFCPTLAKHAMETASGDFRDFTKPYALKDKKKLTNTDIGLILEQIPALKIWSDSIEGYAFDQMTDGKAIPGYKLVTGKAGNKKWKDSDAVVIQKLKKLGVSEQEVVKKKIETPTAVEKILKVKKVKVEEIKNLWNQSKGKPTMAKRSDLKPEIESPTEAAFKSITN